MYTYYFAVATQHFLVEEEPIEEILRERTMYYNSINKNIDFWFIINPDFLHKAYIENFDYNPSLTYATIVSLDPKFIQWLKLRIGFVAIGNFEAPTLKI